jgi:hypothetical protein
VAELAEVGWTVDGLHLARTDGGWLVLGMVGVAPADARRSAAPRSTLRTDVARREE